MSKLIRDEHDRAVAVKSLAKAIFADTHPTPVKTLILRLAEQHLGDDAQMVPAIKQSRPSKIGWGELFFFRPLLMDDSHWDDVALWLSTAVDEEALRWGGRQQYDKAIATGVFTEL